MKRKKGNSWFNKYWILNERWTIAFFISHIAGWVLANIQTLWIVYEIRKAYKRMNQK